MDLCKILRLIPLVQLKSVTKTDRTSSAKWRQLPVPFAWFLKFHMLTSSPSSRNKWLQSPPLQFQLHQKNTWKGECESLNEKRDGRNIQHLPLQIAQSFSCFFCMLGLSWQQCSPGRWDMASLACVTISPAVRLSFLPAHLLIHTPIWLTVVWPEELSNIDLVSVPIGEEMAGVRSFPNFAGCSKNNCTTFNK